MHLTDIDVLRTIAARLGEMYNNKISLRGIMVFHSIGHPRIQESAKRNILMLKNVYGDDALRNVVFVTSMWDVVPEASAEARERQLVDMTQFSGSIVSKGSTVLRHDNTAASARAIVGSLIDNGDAAVKLDIPEEMADKGKLPDKTEASQELETAEFEQPQSWEALLVQGFSLPAVPNWEEEYGIWRASHIAHEGFSDSGYDSMNLKSDKGNNVKTGAGFLLSEDIAEEQALPEQLDGTDTTDNDTIYSSSSSILLQDVELYVSAIAQELVDLVPPGIGGSPAGMGGVARALPELLKAFALMIGHRADTSLHREIMYIVHKRRRSVHTHM